MTTVYDAAIPGRKDRSEALAAEAKRLDVSVDALVADGGPQRRPSQTALWRKRMVMCSGGADTLAPCAIETDRALSWAKGVGDAATLARARITGRHRAGVPRWISGR